ncbi:HD-GYP domain-containing protein [Radiobacillus sp. PE A8.2]|uniref:HD-GYP domain-containing protein n=1 Tax=Radiobacillus sp. PE A8.2 TaxID=3380349 RepID=UPI003890BD47
MFSKYLSINNPTLFRYAFVILLLVSKVLSIIIHETSNFFILYIFAAVFLGIGFYNASIWILMLLNVVIVLCRFFLISDHVLSVATFLIYLLTYFLITFITVQLMKNIQKVKQDNIELTVALANALDSRDTYTLHHSENVAKYALQIAVRLKLSKELCNIIRIGSLLHDIGKIGIPENILTKPDKLTTEEYDKVKTHPEIGYEIIKHVATFKGNGVLDIVLYHHEKYDGTGYPRGLKGNSIPLVARIVAIADSFDAMTSHRIYRSNLDVKYGLDEIRKNKGTQYDPAIADVFLSLFEE